LSGYDSNLDPKGLIHESFQIEGITASECRSIFLDWSLNLPDSVDTGFALRALVDRYAQNTPNHPMSLILQEGMTTITTPKRRGGWRSRTRN
jgi:hypothetical protein